MRPREILDKPPVKAHLLLKPTGRLCADPAAASMVVKLQVQDDEEMGGKRVLQPIKFYVSVTGLH